MSGALAEDVPRLEQTGVLDVVTIHAEHATFVWKTLQRLGVRAADLEDMLQETFLVVHRRLSGFDHRSSVKTWLFGICLRVAAGYRRRAHLRREEPNPPRTDQIAGAGATPEDTAAQRQARAQLGRLLETLDLEKRAVFVMFEIEGLPCDEIAEIVGVPVGTVYSRLHVARKQFAAAVARYQRDEARRMFR